MKKTYMTPSISGIQVRTQQIIAASPYSITNDGYKININNTSVEEEDIENAS